MLWRPLRFPFMRNGRYAIDGVKPKSEIAVLLRKNSRDFETVHDVSIESVD